MHNTPIKTAEEHRAALARIEQFWDAEPNTQEGDELEALVTSIQIYEEEHYPIEAPDPNEAIKFRMEQQGK